MYLQQQFFMVLFITNQCQSTIKSDTKELKEKIEHEKELNLIKDKILNQLHLHEKDLTYQRTKKTVDNKTNSALNRNKIKTNFLKQKLKNLELHTLEAFIPAKDVVEGNDDMIFHFQFKHSIFKNGRLSKAMFSFYKDSSPEEVEEEIIAVAEVIFGHVHVINTVKIKNDMNGWVRVDIKEHVKYWAQDFDDGGSENRVLKIMCINCKGLFTSRHTGEYVPYMSIAVDSAL